jgi:hypothetical protein
VTDRDFVAAIKMGLTLLFASAGTVSLVVACCSGWAAPDVGALCACFVTAKYIAR